MSGKREGAAETPQQRALVDLAQKQVADYRERWLPLQMNLAQSVDAMGAPDSTQRERAAGMVSTENEARFADAREQVEAGLGNAGQLGSAKGKMAVAGIGEDQATSTGLGLTQADQQIDDAYVTGLGQIMALGLGQKGSAITGATNTAAMSGRRAAADASASLARRSGNARLAGQVGGLGLSYAMSPTAGGAGLGNPGFADDSFVRRGQVDF